MTDLPIIGQTPPPAPTVEQSAAITRLEQDAAMEIVEILEERGLTILSGINVSLGLLIRFVSYGIVPERQDEIVADLQKHLAAGVSQMQKDALNPKDVQ